MADFELFARDSKRVVIPVRDESGLFVDLSTADVVWRLSEWSGGVAILEKTRTAGGPDTEVGIEQSSGQPYPASLVIKILAEELDVPGGTYVHTARIVFSDASDTVRSGSVTVHDAPRPAA